MTLLAVALAGRGAVNPDEPVLYADDEAFLRGRAAFETVRVYGGRPFRLDDHLARLAGSAARIGLPPVDRVGMHAAAETALEEAGVADAVLRFFWTPGREDLGQPVGLALVSAIPDGYDEQRGRGQRLVALDLGIVVGTLPGEGWLLTGVKSTSYAVNMAAEAEARDRGADDAVFLSHEGIVLEGPVTNVWWRRGETLYTPSLDLGILAGITRQTLLEEAGGLGYEVREGAFGVDELAGSEEAFTSSSVREVMPAVALDGQPIGDSRPGPAAADLQGALRRRAGAA